MTETMKRPRDLVLPHPVGERMPLVGRVRLGHQEKSGSGSMFPRADDHFVVTEDDSGITSAEWAAAFRQVCGQEPRELKILLAGATPEEVLRGAMKLYGASKLKRRCDGETCNERLAAGGWAEKPCVCKARDIAPKSNQHCQRSWSFTFVLQEVPGLGAADLVTGSDISAGNLAARLAFWHKIAGDLTLFPCVLYMKQVTVSPEGQTKKVWVLDLRDDGTWTPRQAIAGEVRPAVELVERARSAGELPPAPVERDEERDPLVHRDADAPPKDADWGHDADPDETTTLAEDLKDAIARQLRDLSAEHGQHVLATYGAKVSIIVPAVAARHGEAARDLAAALDSELAEPVDPADVTVDDPDDIPF